MDAFDSGIVNSRNLPRVRRIIVGRLAKGKALGSKKPAEPYTVTKLRSDVRRITRAITTDRRPTSIGHGTGMVTLSRQHTMDSA